MRSTHKTILTTALAALALALFLARFLAISNSYPFYFIWDMDMVDTVDLFLINSGLLPDHINHPCFGMYLVQSLAARVGHGLGAVSAITLGQLDASLNPAAPIAEMTTFLRLHTPYLEILLIVFLWAAASLILRPGRWLALLFLLALGVQESFAFHSSMIRTELYAMVFWSAAVCALALAARARTSRGAGSAITLAGMLLGLAFLTKIQAVLHLALFIPLALLAFSLTDRKTAPLRTAPDRRAARAFLIVSVANLAVFLLLIAISWGVPLNPEAGGVFVEQKAGTGLNPFALAFLLGAAALAGAQAAFFLHPPQDARRFRLLCAATLLCSGFLAAFLLHFLMFANPGASLGYLRVVFKMAFLREIESQQKLLYIIVKPLGVIAYHPLLFAVNLGLLLTLAAGHLKKFIKIEPVQLACCAALSLLTLAMPWITVRYFLRDFIWVEIPLTLLNFIYLALIWRGARRFAPGLRAATACAMALVLLVTAAHAAVMPRRLAMNNNELGWNIDFWQKGIYNKNHPQYTKMMERHYSWPLWTTARRSAVSHAADRRAAEFVFQNQPVDLRQVGLVAEGFPVWTARQDWRIAALSENVRGALVVDSAALPRRSKYFAKNEYVEKHSEYMDKFAPAPAGDLLAILPRQDLEVLLFVQPEDLARLVGSPQAALQTRITLQRGAEKLELAGLAIGKYTELPVSQLTRDYFFVIRRKW